MSRLLLKAALIGFAIAAYMASPFVTAWSIREAARTGDTDYLARAIDWPSVRETLKPDLSRIALDLPGEEQPTATKPGLWQCFKAYLGQGAVNRAIDGYMTPEGLPQLFSMRKAYRDYTGASDETAALPVLERVERFWTRIKRAEFTGLTTFEVDMADKNDANRIYLGKLELTRSGWMLKELRIRMLTTASAAPQTLMSDMASPPAARGKSWSTGFISPAQAATTDTGTGTRAKATPSFWERAKAAAR
ncbi:MAG: DUF2939 domain-containing protein [Hyphomicrobium sp.]